MEDRDIRDTLRREIRRDPRKAIAIACTHISDLWMVILEACGHPHIDYQAAMQLRKWEQAILEGVRHALVAGACEMRVRNSRWLSSSVARDEDEDGEQS